MNSHHRICTIDAHLKYTRVLDTAFSAFATSLLFPTRFLPVIRFLLQYPEHIVSPSYFSYLAVFSHPYPPTLSPALF
jgi:hypothetical protein